MPEKKASSQGAGAFSLLGAASVMGMHMVSGPLVGAVLGWLIDRKLGSWPVGAGVGLCLGIIAGFRMVFADARTLRQQEMDSQHDERSTQDDPRADH